LDDPVDAGERQIKAHLSEFLVAGRTPKPAQVARFSALVDELSAIVLSAPGGLAYAEDFPIPEGVLLVAWADSWGARIVPKKRDSS